MDFPSNSQTAKPSGEPTGEKKEKVVLKVVEGGAIRRKQPLSSRLKEALFGDDAKAAVHHAIWDIAIPAGRDMVFNAFVEGLRRAAYGENSGPRHSAGNIGTRLVGSALGHTAYDRFAKPGRRRPLRHDQRAAQPRRREVGLDRPSWVPSAAYRRWLPARRPSTRASQHPLGALVFKIAIGFIAGAFVGRKVLLAAWTVLEDALLGRSK
jgi:hypothetical protein